MEIGFAFSNFKSDIHLGPRLEGGTTRSLSSPKFSPDSAGMAGDTPVRHARAFKDVDRVGAPEE